MGRCCQWLDKLRVRIYLTADGIFGAIETNEQDEFEY